MKRGVEARERPRSRSSDDRQAQIWACLRDVMDPELDESVIDLNFVTRADVDAKDRVHIEFRLPTYWCAANFSFLMADDMRRSISALDWVKGVSVVLGEHMYADKINAGLALGRSFQETFGAEADGASMICVRHSSSRRSSAGRLRYSVTSSTLGQSPAEIVSLTLTELGCLPLDDAGETLVQRYFERRAVVGPASGGEPAFVDANGSAAESRQPCRIPVESPARGHQC